MDLWDLTKLMWRRWYVTVPMLLLTALAVSLVVVNVGPEYQATGHVAVVPSPLQRQAAAGEVTLINPWNEEALAHAASIRLESAQLADELAARGYKGEWSVEVTGRLPVITIEVVAPTAEEAVAILRQLQAVVEEEVQLRQDDLNLPDDELITTVRYDEGESIETTASRLRRIVVAVAGAGFVLTMGVVVAFDALVRWRLARSRRGEPVPAPAPAPRIGAGEQVRPRYEFTTAPTPGPVASGNGAGRHEPLPTVAKRSTEPPAPISPPPSEPAPAAPAAWPPEAEPVSSAPPASQEPVAGAEPSDQDSTIVLPLSNAPWAGRRRNDWPSPPGKESGQEDPAGASSR